MDDKEEFDNAVRYFQSIITNNITSYSGHKVGSTFIGIKTNISGNYKLHIYILLFPFIKSDVVVPYCNNFPNLYFKDLCLDVSENFYLWLYEEMKRQNSLVVMSLDKYLLKVVHGSGDPLLSVDINCKEKKEWMDLDFEDWYEKKIFNNIFTINITNPYLYMVPFPVKPIIIKTFKKLNNYIEILP